METRSPRILWSVNPFVEDQALIKRMAHLLNCLSAQWEADIEPIYILADVPPNVKVLPLLVKGVEQQAQRMLQGLLRGIRSPHLQSLKLLMSASSQLRDQAGVLLHYARERRADLIAVSTRARRGPQRWIMGSFTETLIHESDFPLYVINPMEYTPRPIRSIFFPTDFSENSQRVYRQVIQTAKGLGATVVLFHKVSNAYSPMYEVGYGGNEAYAHFHQELVDQKRANAHDWAAEGRRLGVLVKPVVDYSTDRSTTEAIVSRSRRYGGMIAMAGRLGDRVPLLGGITRQVVRTAQLPVWVVHPAVGAQMQTPPLRERRGA